MREKGNTMTVPDQPFAVGVVGMDRPWQWLTMGWRDLCAAPLVSLSYGAGFVLAGYGLSLGLIQLRAAYMILPVAAGFLLLGPMLAVGLYEMSRRIEAGERPGLGVVCFACRRNPAQIALMGLVLMLFVLAWVRVATLIFAIFFTRMPPTLDDLVLQTLLSDVSLPFLLVGTAAGGVLAAIAFSISVVSVPMLLDRQVDVITAVLTSIVVVRANWKVMWGWGCLIALLMGAGFVTFYIGLAVFMPLVGHASWHAYRDLVPASAVPEGREL